MLWGKTCMQMFKAKIPTAATLILDFTESTFKCHIKPEKTTNSMSYRSLTLSLWILYLYKVLSLLICCQGCTVLKWWNGSVIQPRKKWQRKVQLHDWNKMIQMFCTLSYTHCYTVDIEHRTPENLKVGNTVSKSCSVEINLKYFLKSKQIAFISGQKQLASK